MKSATERSSNSDAKKIPTSTESQNAVAADVDNYDDENKYKKIADDDDNNDNNDDDGQLASKRMIREEIISQFPQDHLVHCFGYGSGVFTQSLTKDNAGSTATAGMLDLILVVDDTQKFHEANLRRFPHHYAPWLRLGGPDLVTKMQRQGLPMLPDAHVLFHVVDKDDNNNLPKMKYGVVDKQDLVRDLTEWDSLYLAGRLHKPTLPIVADDDDDDLLQQAQVNNLQAATAAALLLSSSMSSSTTTTATTMHWSSLYRKISALSYTGDFRMQVGGEDPRKIDKLVQAPGQLQRFHDLYRPILKSYESAGLLSTSYSCSSDDIGDGGLEWNSNDSSTISHLRQQLPRSLREGNIVNNKSNINNNILVDHDALSMALAAIVAPAARNQSFKGIFTLGFRKSIQYASAKLSKGLLSRK